ncbi:putative cytochrome P450 [Hypoxylon rubiginosum]|uniref:Cytochrome P450 n=1 Tax=Hypoxylon rubiginosum TaxID=110542 RepID=A0ACB9YQS6_9PEZI|nr:putative cytochrome P450 [Hypoxylon rubiginosum]
MGSLIVNLATTCLAFVGLPSYLGILFSTGLALYNGFLHPLRKYPGPLVHRMTIIPKAFNQIRGRLPLHVSELHGRYGPVRDIYGYKTDQEEFPKHRGFYRVFNHFPTSIINADTNEHALLRRQLTVGFSDRAMREQEPIMGSYVDLLIPRLRDATQRDSRQNMQEWYTWTTFDMIGDLSFGVDGGFGCLKNASYNPWVKLINTSICQQGVMLGLIALGFRGPLEKFAQRMKGGGRPDFLDGLIRNKEALNLDAARMATNASVLILAGSETTATLLCGATYLLTAHPDMLKRLEREVRSAFKNEEDITLTSIGQLSFMLACLNETMRCYPPFVTGAPRQTPKDVIIADNFVPQGTVVSVFQYAPERFAPERWMEDPEYKTDQRDAMQPFSTGPRNCIGRNLAYAETRLILARLVYNFDMSLAADSDHWLHNQKAYIVWDKPPLNVHLKPVA